MAIWETHPRPQLTRPRWHDLGGTWRFAYDDANGGLDAGWQDDEAVFDREIIVPFPPESAASGIGDGSYHPVVWYRRAFTLPPEDQAGRVLLHCGAVDYRAHVWVDGALVATHEGGHTPFTADITAVVARTDRAEHRVVVRAEDDPHDLTQPRGKQDWQAQSHRIWYRRTTGIWQPVWLEPVPTVHIADVHWIPDLDRALVTAAITLNQAPPASHTLRVRLSLRGQPLGDVAASVSGTTTRVTVPLDAGHLAMDRDRMLWSPEYPNLLDATLALERDGASVDTVESYVGMRSAATANGRFVLNGRPYYPRLVLSQGYWPQSHLAAPSAEALRHEAERVKELGFNGVRIHQKVEDPRFLGWCDRLGLLVWGEMANAYAFSADAAARLTREWTAVIRRDRSHPSIITWVPINESWGVPNIARDPAQQALARALYHLTHALDGTRPVIGNDGWEHTVTDILGIHDYALDGATLRQRYGTPEAVERTIATTQPGSRVIALATAIRAGEPVMLSEFGGIGFAPARGERWYGYGTVSDGETYAATYAELVQAILEAPTIAGFCYTQLTDTEQETNGLLTADRQPKVDPARIRAANTRPSRAVPYEAVEAARRRATGTAPTG